MKRDRSIQERDRRNEKDKGVRGKEREGERQSREREGDHQQMRMRGEVCGDQNGRHRHALSDQQVSEHVVLRAWVRHQPT